MHTYIYTYMQYITLMYVITYIALHDITLHYITLHYITLYHIILYYVKLHYMYMILHDPRYYTTSDYLSPKIKFIMPYRVDGLMG